MCSRVAPLDVIELLLLVDVDQYVTLDRLEDPRPLHFARLKHDITVRQDDGLPPAAKPLDDIERPRVEAVRKRVVDQIRGHCEEVDVRRVFDPVALKGPEVIAISELGKQLFEDRPVAVAAGSAEDPFEMKP